LIRTLKETSQNKRFISVLVPCRNEEGFIAAVIENILAQDYPKDLMEVFFIDGLSTDNTEEIIKKYVNEHSHLKLILNPRKFVPQGLNKAIKKSKGDIIIRMDAHSIYPTNYISALSKHLYDLDADNVGGVWDIHPGDDTATARAIAFTNGHIFGIGNAQYRYAEKDIRVVDTVPFGCYKKEVFDEIGLFDEDLSRNQDDELNARLKKNGGKIFLIPSIRIKYFARPNFGTMAKMFYQYGLFKPLVNKKLGQLSTLRQLFPALMIIGTAVGLAISFFFKPFLSLVLFSWALYILISLIISVKYSTENKDIKALSLIPFSFLTIHLSYGWGYIKGAIFLLFGKKPGGVQSSR